MNEAYTKSCSLIDKEDVDIIFQRNPEEIMNCTTKGIIYAN